jgi:iron complex outermembrane receptor protein
MLSTRPSIARAFLGPEANPNLSKVANSLPPSNSSYTAVLCNYVVRDDGGNLTRVFRPYLNLDQAYVRGTDFEIDYRRDVNWLARADESFSVRILGGKLDHRTNTVAGSVPDEFAGSLGYPDLTANATVSYGVGPWSVQLQQRYIDEVLLNRNWVEGIDIDDNTIQSKSWTNLVFGYTHEQPNSGFWRLNFNVQNLFDDDPPIIPSTGGGRFGAQITSNTYDVWGRRYELTFNYTL